MSVAQYKCQNCGNSFAARTADRARGWALFCSKSCKATKQTKDQIKKARKARPWQRFDKAQTHEDRLEMLRSPWIIEPLYTDGERDGEVFLAGNEGWDDHK